MSFVLLYASFICLFAFVVFYFAFLLVTLPATLKRHAMHPGRKANFFVDAFLYLTSPIRITFLLLLSFILKAIYTGIILLVIVLTLIYQVLRRFGSVFGRVFRAIDAYVKRIQEMIIWMEENTQEYVVSKHTEALKWGESYSGLILTRLPMIDLLTASTSIQLTQFFNLTDLFAPILLSVALDSKRNIVTRNKAIHGLAKLDRSGDLLHILQPTTSPEVCLETIRAMQQSFSKREVVIGWSLLARHSNLDIRLKAAENLDELAKVSEAQSAYMALMNDEETPMPIRIQAAGRLARQGKLPETLALLCEQMETNSVPLERLAAAEALCAAEEKTQAASSWLDTHLLSRAKEARQVISDFIFNTEADTDTRAEAVRILGRLGHGQALKELAANPDLELPERWQVILGLLQVCEYDLAATSWLELATQPKLPANLQSDIVSSANRLLSDKVSTQTKEILLPKALDVLMGYAQDEANDGTLRLEAAKAIEKLGWYDKASAIYLLLSNSQSLRPVVRREASQAMRQLITRPVT